MEPSVDEESVEEETNDDIERKPFSPMENQQPEVLFQIELTPEEYQMIINEKMRRGIEH